MTSTADGTLSARISEFKYIGSPVRDAEQVRLVELLLNAKQQGMGNSQVMWGPTESSIKQPAGASWFRTIERRIANSSTPDPDLGRSDEWLPQATAIAALKFFR